MFILKQTKNLLKFQPFLNRFAFSGILGQQVALNPVKNAVRFESQNLLWTYDEFEKHANAVAYGLVELGYKPGDKILLWVEKAQSAEVITAIIGAAKAGVNIIPSVANSQYALDSDLSDCTGIIFSPNSSLEGEKYIDVVNNVLPELADWEQGKEFSSTTFPKLKHVIHTGPYSFTGTLKYRQFLTYASKNFNTLSLPESDDSRPLLGNKSLADIQSDISSWRSSNGVSNETVIVSGDAKTVKGVTGILNSLLFGNYTVYTGGYDEAKVQEISDLHENAIVILDDEISSNASGFSGKKVDVYDRKSN